jgi:hypothetical protein
MMAPRRPRGVGGLVDEGAVDCGAHADENEDDDIAQPEIGRRERRGDRIAGVEDGDGRGGGSLGQG